jgi:hypothetical protein
VRGDRHVGVAELAADGVDVDAFAPELDGVGVAERVRVDPDAQAGAGGGLAERAADEVVASGRPAVGPCRTGKSAPIGYSRRSVSQGCSWSQPQSSMALTRRLPPLPLRTVMA